MGMSGRADAEHHAEALGQVFQDLSLAVLDHKFSICTRDLVDPNRALGAEIEKLTSLYDELREVTRLINNLQGTSPAVLQARLMVAFFYTTDADTLCREAFQAIAGLITAFRHPYVDRVEERLACRREALRMRSEGT